MRADGPLMRIDLSHNGGFGGTGIMGNVKKTRPIRLTNRTAIGLRKTAQRVKSAWLVAMCVVTMLVTVLAVTLGFSWLPAVPLTLLLGGAVIALMMLASRSQYLMLISQAICTEAASRQMEERQSEQKRREKAIEQLAAMRADVREAQKKGVPDREGVSEESLLFDLLTGRDVDEEIPDRRSGEEDDEMYAASYKVEEEPDEDLYPPKKSRQQQPAPRMEDTAGGNTRPVMKNAAAPAELTQPAPKEGTSSPRRRRRSTPEGTAPLQLIRGDQAQ